MFCLECSTRRRDARVLGTKAWQHSLHNLEEAKRWLRCFLQLPEERKKREVSGSALEKQWQDRKSTNLYHKRVRLGAGKHFCTMRADKCLSWLSKEVAGALCLPLFKRHLDECPYQCAFTFSQPWSSQAIGLNHGLLTFWLTCWTVFWVIWYLL